MRLNHSLMMNKLNLLEMTEKLHLTATGPDTLEIQWEGPIGKVPGHCLEWEVEQRQEAPGGKITLVKLCRATCSKQD